MKVQYKYAVALTASLGLFMAVLDNTIVNVSLTAMEKAFNTDINSIEWVITGYFLSQAAIIPAAGYFGNRFGVKRVFVLALVIFTLGSLMCGLTAAIFGSSGGGQNFLIAFRVFQGIGGGALFPLATSITFSVFTPAERPAASAVISIPVLLAPTLGPTVGGLIVDSIGWEWIFFINVPVGIVAVFLLWRIYQPEKATRPAGVGQPVADGGKPGVPAVQSGTGSGFDFIGLILSMVGVVLVVYAFTLVSQTKDGTITPQNPNGDIWGWSYWLVWLLFGLGLLVLAIFSVYELRIAKDPVLDLRLFKSRDFTTATVMTWILRAVVFGSFFLLPLYLQQFKGKDAVVTGLILMPQGIGSAIGIQVGSRLYDRVGPRLLVIGGMLLLTLSSFWLVFTDVNSDWLFFTPILLLRGIGFGWSNLPLQTVALSTVTGRALPKGSSLYNASAQIFSSIGVAVLTTIFIEQTKSHATSLVQAARVAGKPPVQADILLGSAVGGLNGVFLVVSIGTLVAMLACWLLPAQSVKQQQQAAARHEGEQHTTEGSSEKTTVMMD